MPAASDNLRDDTEVILKPCAILRTDCRSQSHEPQFSPLDAAIYGKQGAHLHTGEPVDAITSG